MSADWDKIKAEYIAGGVTYRELAKQHSVSYSQLTKRACAEKWVDKRKQMRKKAETKFIESAARRKAKQADMFDIIADKLLRQISAGIDDGSIVVTGRGYRDITGALKDLREIKGIKSPLDLQEQEARIKKLEKDADPDKDESKNITVVFSTDCDEYSR